MRRSLRILRKLAIVLAILAVLSIAGFTWIAYWPLEGSVDRVEDLVPSDVEYVVRGSWKDIKESGWVQRNAVDHPLHEQLDAGRLLAPGLAQVSDFERQINDSIPGAVKPLMGLLFGTKTFGLEKDVFPGDVIAAGRFCGGPTAKGALPFPRGREWLLLTRVTSVTKFGIAALKHGFVREQIGPNASIDEYPGGFYRVELKSVVTTPAKFRACEGGHSIPPENTIYLARVKDVLALSNSDDLMAKVVDLSNGIGDKVENRSDDFRLKPTEAGIGAAVDMVPLRSFLNQQFSAEGQAKGGTELNAFVTRFMTFNALDRMNATVEPLGLDGLSAHAEITYNPSQLSPPVRSAYALTPEPFATGIARLVPEADTFAVALVKAEPRPLLQAVYDSLAKSSKKLFDDNIRQIGRYKGVAPFLDELAGQLGTNTGVAFSRLSSVFDHVEYKTWFVTDEPDSQPVISVLVRIGPGHTKKQVDDFLADRVLALGFDPPTTVTRGDVTYSRLELKYKVRDFELVKPAYLVTQDHLIISTNEEYLLRIIDTMSGKERPVADSPGFKASTAALPREATLALYADGAILAKYQWDQRNSWVTTERSFTNHANAYRVERQLYYKSRSTNPGGALTEGDIAKVNDEVDTEIDRYRREEYPKFIQEYRGIIDAWSRFRAGAVVMAARQGTIDGGATLLFTPPPGESADSGR